MEGLLHVPDIEILVVPDCPHATPARLRVLEALYLAGLNSRIKETVVKSLAGAQTRGMRGSPTMLVDGRDPFVSHGDEPGSISCRLYSSDDGINGLPSVEQLVAVLVSKGGVDAGVN